MRISDWSSDVCSSDLHDVIAKRAEVRDTEWPERGIVESRRLRQIAGTETCVRKYTITGNNCHNNSPLLEIIEFFFESLSETACTTCANAFAKPQFVPGVGADREPLQTKIGRASGREKVCPY